MLSYEVRADVSKQRLYVAFKGLASDEEVARAAVAIQEAAHRLTAPYTCVADISEFKPLSAVGVDEVKKFIQRCADSGMVAVARISGASAVAKMQLERVAHLVGYASYTVASLAEAEQVLDQHGLAAQGKAPSGPKPR